MRKYFAFSIRRPKSVIVAALAITFFFALQLPRLTKEDSVDKMLPDGDPVLEFTREVEEVFGNDEFLIVAVESPRPFSTPTIEKLARMTLKFSAIPDVTEVISPTNTKNVHGDQVSLYAEPLIDELNPPTSAVELSAYRAAINSKEIFRGNIISDDGDTFGFVLRLARDMDKRAVVDAVAKVVEEERGPEEIYFSGSPAINLRVGEYMSKDMGRFLPLVLVLIVVVLFLGFGTARGVILPVIVLAMSVIWTLGSMAMTGTPMSVIATMIPTLLIAVGSSYTIHVMTQYAEECGAGGGGAEEKLRATLMNIGPTVSLAGLTTVIGFASLMLNDTPILREFGRFCALGISASAVLSLTFLPCCLLLMNPLPRSAARAWLPSRLMSACLRGIGAVNSRRPARVLFAVLALAAASFAGYRHLFIETNAVNFFLEEDPVRQTIQKVSVNFGGTIPLRTVVRSKNPGEILSPSHLRQIEAYQRHLEKIGRVGHTVSIADIVKDMNMALHDGDAAHFAVPGSLGEAEQYLFLYSLSSEPDEFDSLIDPDHTVGTVLARLKQSDEANRPLGTAETREIVENIETYIAGNFDDSLDVAVTGRAVNIVRTSDYIVIGLIRSMLAALVLIFAASALVFRSLRAGLLSIVPLAAAMVLNFGFMAWAGIPLDIATTLVSSIAIGIGVDDSIHYLIRFRRERSGGADPDRATHRTLMSSGRAIIHTSAALALGFSVLLAASFKPVIYFGGLTVLTVLTTTLGALFLLPALARVAGPPSMSDTSDISPCPRNKKTAPAP